MKTDDLRIVKTRPLLSPAILAEEIPLSDTASTRVYEARRAIEAILDGKDARLLVVVGPCSVHDTKAALEYATKLKPIADALSDALSLSCASILKNRGRSWAGRDSSTIRT
jgi:3-deoxy-7-phosphoheptulonate synthase